ncbi:MAG: lytic transglycosylase domain-containing protein [Clostridia bacterium]
MQNNPEFTHHYRKDNTPEQDAIEERIVQSTYKVIAEQIELNREVQAANSRARAAIISIIVATIVIIAVGIWWSVAHADVINMDAIAQIESSGNPLAYNRQSGASGLYQLMPCVVADYNACHPASKIAFKAVFSPVVARTVAEWYLAIKIPQYLRHYGKPVTVENIIWAYSAGIGNVVKGRMPEETKQYLAKYARLQKGR